METMPVSVGRPAIQGSSNSARLGLGRAGRPTYSEAGEDCGWKGEAASKEGTKSALLKITRVTNGMRRSLTS